MGEEELVGERLGGEWYFTKFKELPLNEFP